MHDEWPAPHCFEPSAPLAVNPRAAESYVLLVPGSATAQPLPRPTNLSSSGKGLDLMPRPSLRIAVVAYHFPPSPSVGAQRPGRWVAELRSRGLDVQVVTASLSAEAGDRRHPGADPWVHDVPVRWDPRRLWAKLKRKLGAGKAVAPPQVDAAGFHNFAPPRRMPFLRRHVDAWFWLPDDRQGFIVPAARKVLALHRASPFDAIYVSGPPFSAHVAGLIASRLTGVPLWVEYRDPWLEGKDQHTEAYSAPATHVERKLERHILAHAQGAVVATPGIATMLYSKLADTQHSKVTVTYNGIPSLSPTDSQPRLQASPRLTFLYAGTLYLGRDPRGLLEGLSALHRAGRIDAASVRLLLVGHCRYFRGESVQSMASSLQLDGIVDLQDPVSSSAAGELMLSADVLVLLAQDQPAQIPQKLFDYLGTRKPILAFADRGGEVDRLLDQVGGHVVVTDGASTDAVGEAIEKVMRLAMDGMQRGSPEVLERLTAERQLGTLAHHFIDRVAAITGR